MAAPVKRANPPYGVVWGGPVARVPTARYHRPMNRFRRLRSTLGQGMVEYMLVLSVVAIAAMAAFATYGPTVADAGGEVADNYANGLTNDGGKMEVK